MASAAGTSQTETIAIVVGLAVVAFSLKDAFKGIGKGIGDVGAGVASFGVGLQHGLENITGAIPAFESGVGQTGQAIGSSLDAFGGFLDSIGHDIDLTDPAKYRWIGQSTGYVGGAVDGWLHGHF